MSGRLSIAAALILDDHGRMLLVRKRGTHRYMQAGGKLEPGELADAALVRELHEELGLTATTEMLTALGRFTAEAANEPGHTVDAHVFGLDLAAALPAGATAQTLRPAAELDDLVWADPAAPAVPLAPLTEHVILPLARERCPHA